MSRQREPTVGDLFNDPVSRKRLAAGFERIRAQYVADVKRLTTPGLNYWCDRCGRIHYLHNSAIGRRHATPAMLRVADLWAERMAVAS